MPDLDKVCMIGWSYGGFLSAGRAGRAERVQGRMRRRPARELDAVRHALHRALSGPRPDVYYRNGIVQDAPKLDARLC